MFKFIPAHSLVVGVGPDARTRSDTIKRYFDAHEIVSVEDVCYSLVGERVRPDLNATVFAEIRHRIEVKLSLGERIVVDAANLRREDRMSLARIASDNGAPVFYLVTDPSGAVPQGQARFKAAEWDLTRGDGLAEVVDWRHHVPKPISKEKPELEDLRARYNGITVIADVHGMYPSLLSALSWARARGHYVMLLGDVIDYGPDTLEVADEIYRLVMRGDGEMILGNHERKIFRWASQMEQGRSSVRLSEGNRVTTSALNSLSLSARRRWLGRFRGLVARSSHIRILGNMAFAHAGIHPKFWVGEASPREIETWALFGEFDSEIDDGRPQRRYTWTEAVPEGETVIVGHDIRSTEKPVIMESPLGGQTIFLDTGSGKGGFLTSADLRFTDAGLRVENFNRY